MRQDNKTKRVINVSWWQLLLGVVLLGFGVMVGIAYFNNSRNISLGFLTVLAIAPGVILVYISIKAGEIGFAFSNKGRKQYRGDENAIVLFAKRSQNGKDIPVCISFLKLNNIPKDARLHYFRNYKKHFYELYNNTTTKKLEPVVLPDKKPSPPELFKIAAVMQPYKACMDYNPPTLIQKVAPGILLGAMGIVGLLMLITGG